MLHVVLTVAANSCCNSADFHVHLVELFVEVATMRGSIKTSGSWTLHDTCKYSTSRHLVPASATFVTPDTFSTKRRLSANVLQSKISFCNCTLDRQRTCGHVYEVAANVRETSPSVPLSLLFLVSYNTALLLTLIISIVRDYPSG